MRTKAAIFWKSADFYYVVYRFQKKNWQFSAFFVKLTLKNLQEMLDKNFDTKMALKKIKFVSLNIFYTDFLFYTLASLKKIKIIFKNFCSSTTRKCSMYYSETKNSLRKNKWCKTLYTLFLNNFFLYGKITVFFLFFKLATLFIISFD